MKRWLILGVMVTAIAVIYLRGRSDSTTVLTGRSMGTSWKLACTGSVPTTLAADIASELEKWEQVMSQWRDDSDLSRFNQGEPATPELQRVIILAEKIREQTGSSFDIHQLDAVHRAGFGPPGKGLDLSAIGKGFAVDRVGDRLRAVGIDHFIFELGGEVLAGEGTWTCTLWNPDPNQPGTEVFLSRQAIATSGNYHQARHEPDGLHSHLIDPRTGEPVVRPPSSVTVFADTCAAADAWATSLFVQGPKAQPKSAPQFRWVHPE